MSSKLKVVLILSEAVVNSRCKNFNWVEIKVSVVGNEEWSKIVFLIEIVNFFLVLMSSVQLFLSTERV